MQDLLKDDNKRSACPTINLTDSSKHSSYKYNRASYFLECRLTALQWDREAELVRQAHRLDVQPMASDCLRCIICCQQALFALMTRLSDATLYHLHTTMPRLAMLTKGSASNRCVGDVHVGMPLFIPTDI